MDSTIALSKNNLNNPNMRLQNNDNKLLGEKLLTKISLLAFFACLLCFSTLSSAKDQTRFSVTNVTASVSENGIETLSIFQLALSSKAYEAINHGVPINIVLSYAEPLKRFWGTSYKTVDKTVFKLSRNALSDNYQLFNSAAFQTHQFISIDEALKHIAVFQIKRLENISNNQVAVRVHLDIFNLPPQIRASAFFSGSWRHDSLWTVWEVST